MTTASVVVLRSLSLRMYPSLGRKSIPVGVTPPPLLLLLLAWDVQLGKAEDEHGLHRHLHGPLNDFVRVVIDHQQQCAQRSGLNLGGRHSLLSLRLLPLPSLLMAKCK